MSQPIQWTPESDEFLRKNFRAMRHSDIAVHLGCSARSLSSRLRKMGLRRWVTKPFTAAEDQIILSGKGRTVRSIAIQLGRVPAVVTQRAKRLGIKSWKEFNGGHRPYRGYEIRRMKRGPGVCRRVGEHRARVEDSIGRPLTDDERVHHINLKKRDNRVENLHLCATPSAHSLAHHSINAVIPVLLDRGIIWFDRVTGTYRLRDAEVQA